MKYPSVGRMGQGRYTDWLAVAVLTLAADRNRLQVHGAEADVAKIFATGALAEEVLAGHGQKLVADRLVFVVHFAVPFGFDCLRHGMHSTAHSRRRLLRMSKRCVTNCY